MKLEVYKVFMGLSQIAPEDLPDETECGLGKWYYAGEGKSRYAGQSLYRKIETPHQAMHREARRALTCFYTGDYDTALVALAAMETANLAVMVGLACMVGGVQARQTGPRAGAAWPRLRLV